MRHKLLVLSAAMLLPISAPIPAHAQQVSNLTVKIDGVEEGKTMSELQAFCSPDGNGSTRDGGNVSPGLQWSGAPTATQSYALIVVDRDVPANFDPANKPGVIVPDNATRRDYYHWVIADIPRSTTSLQSQGTIGKIGRNDFGNRTKGRNGYDGPCPPWNDERMHRYHFMVYALDVPSLNLGDGFTGKQVQDAMQGHVLAMGEVVGLYSTNPKVH